MSAPPAVDEVLWAPWAERLLAWAPAPVRGRVARLQGSPLGARLARGAFWSLAGTVVARCLTLLTSVIAARLLGRHDFGVLGAIQSTLGMFAVFAGFGLGLTATKFVAEFRHADPARAGRIIALSELVSLVTGLVGAAVLVALAPLIAARALNDPSLAGLLRAGAALLLLSAVTGAQVGALSGFEAFRTAARASLVAGLLALPLTVALIYWGGVHGSVWALAAAAGCGAVCNQLAVRAEARRAGVPIRLAGALADIRILWSFSLPTLFSAIVIGIVFWYCSVLLVRQPNGFAEMGVYNVANQWFTAVQFLPSVLGQAVLPILAQQVAAGDQRQARWLLLAAVKMNAVVVLPIVLLGCLASPVLMGLYGASFGPEWPALAMMLVAAGMLAVQTPIGHVIAATDRMWLGAAMNFGWAVVLAGSAYLLAHRGAFGMSAARTIAYIAHSVWSVAFAVIVLRARRPAHPPSPPAP